MKSFTTIAAAVAMLSTSVSAQYYNITSAPFQLLIQQKGYTSNPYVGSVLTACHAGAAIEALCILDPGNKTVTPSISNTFHFNTSASSGFQDNTYGVQGELTWKQPVNGGSQTYSNAMNLFYNVASNVALPLIEPSYTSTLVSFDKSNKMLLQSYYDDTVSPIATGQKPYYRWAVCKINYSGYQYIALNWVLGSGKAQNPTCVEVDVVRKFT